MKVFYLFLHFRCKELGAMKRKVLIQAGSDFISEEIEVNDVIFKLLSIVSGYVKVLNENWNFVIVGFK